MNIQYEIIIRLLLSLFLGLLIGLERKSKELGVGMRTSSLVVLTSCLFTVITMQIFDPTNIARIAQGLIAGVGFIGAALVWREKIKDGVIPHGLTTAVTIWILTAIGFTVGVGYYTIALVTTFLVLITLLIKKIGIE